MNRMRRGVIGGLATTALLSITRLLHAQPVRQAPSPLTPEQRASSEAMHKRMMAAFPYEHVTVAGKDALTEWQRWKTAGRGWPVVIGGDEEMAQLADQFTSGDPAVSGIAAVAGRLRSPAQILAAARSIHSPADLRKWAGGTPSGERVAPMGDWPDDMAGQDGSFHPSVAVETLSRKIRDRVHILLLPTRQGWQVPAYLRWGNWNACPPPEYHVTALHDWHERYGAELVGISGDVMNVRVQRRPKDRTEALALARDMYAYCPDIVDQGTESLTALAAGLMAWNWWFFWWD